MTNLNGLYIAEMPLDSFMKTAREYLAPFDWAANIPEEYFGKVCQFMQSRVKRFVDVETWSYFFLDMPVYDEAAIAKYFKDANFREALRRLPEAIQNVASFTAAEIEAAIGCVTDTLDIPHGKLNQTVRAAVTGTNIGAGIYETIELIGRDKTLARLEEAIHRFAQN